MSRTVDERVVEMQFDNKHFEENVRESMSTLDKLKKKLNVDEASDSLRELERVGKHFDMSAVGRNVSKIADQFNLLGRITLKIKDDIAGYVSSIIENFARIPKQMTFDQIGAGWAKYGEKASSVQTIMAATGRSVEDVEDQMRKLMWYTDETSYSFTDMSQNIGKFTNAGVGLEDATTAMMGISNWAALAGANVTEAGRAMYNLSQAMSVGSVKLIDWKSIEMANMATMNFKQQVIDTAVAMGELQEGADGLIYTLKGTEVTAQGLSKTLDENWFTSEVLVEVLKKYGEYAEEVYKQRKEGELAADTIQRIGDMGMELGKKAFLAAQEYRTAGDVINATTDAVSTKWMGLFQLFFGNAEEAKRVWSTLGEAMYDVFASPLDALTDLLAPAFEDPWDQLRQRIKETALDYDAWYDILLKIGQEQGVITAYENYGGGAAKGGARWWATREDIARSLLRAMYETKDNAVEVTASLEDLYAIVQEVWNGKWGNNPTRKQMLDAAYNAGQIAFSYEQVQDALNAQYYGQEYLLTTLTDEQLTTLQFTEEEIEKIKELREEILDANSDLGKVVDRINRPSGQDLFFKSIQNVIAAGGKLASAIGEAWSEIFPPTTSERIYKIIESVERFTEKLILSDGVLERVKQHFRGVFAAIDIVWTVFKEVAGGVKDIFKAFLPSSETTKKIFDFTGSISDALVSFDEMIKKTGVVKNAIRVVVESITAGIRNIKAFFAEIPMISGSLVESLKQNHPEWVEAWHNFAESISDFIQRFKGEHPKFAEVWDSFKAKMAEFTGDFGGSLRKISDKLKEWINKIKESDVGTQLFENISSGAEKVGNLFTDLLNKLSSDWKEVEPTLTHLLDGVGKLLKSLWGGIGDIFKNNNLGQIGQFFSGIMGGYALWSSTDLIEDAHKILKQYKRTMKAYVREINARALKQIAIAIGILAGSLWLIAKIPSDRLTAATQAMERLVFALGALSVVMGRLSVKTKNFTFDKAGLGTGLSSLTGMLEQQNTARTLLKMATTMLILSQAVKVLAQLDPKLMWSAVGAITVLMLALGVVSRVLPSDRRVAKLGKTFKSLGKALVYIAASFKVLETIKDPEAISRGMDMMLGATISLTAMMIAMRAARVDSLQMEALCAALVGLSAAMIAMALSMKILDSGVGPEAFAMSLISLAGALTMLVLAAAAVKHWDLDKSLEKLGSAALKIGGGMFLAGAGLVAFSLGLTALAASATVAAGAAYVILEILDILLKGIANWLIENVPLIATTFVVVVSAMAEALAESAYDIAEDLVVALVGILTAVSNHIDELVEPLLNIVVVLIQKLADHMPEIMAAVIDLINGIFGGLAEAFKGDDYGLKSMAIVGAIWAMIPAIKELAKLKSDALKALPAAGVCVAIFGAIAGILYLVRDMDGKNATLNMIAIGGAMIVLAGIVAGFVHLTPALEKLDDAAIWKGFFKLGEILVGLIVLFAIIGAISVGINELAKICGSEDGIVPVLETGFLVLKTIAKGLGEVAGNLVGGFSSGMLEPLLDLLEDLTEEDFKGLVILVNMIEELAMADLVTAFADIMRFVTKAQREDYATQLTNFAKGMVAFAEQTKDLDSEKVEAASRAGIMLNVMRETFPRENGWVQDIIGNIKDISKYGGELSSFGWSLKNFAEAVDGLDTDDVETGARAGVMLAAMTSTFPREDGVWQHIIGNIRNFSEYGEDLNTFAQAMIDFGTKAKDIDTWAIAKATRTFADMATANQFVDMSATGNWGMLSASGVLDTFGNSYLYYYEIISGFDKTKLDDARKHLEEMVDISTNEDNAKHIKDLSTALDTLSSFSVDGMVTSFEGAAPRMYTAGKDAIEQFLQGVTDGGVTEQAAVPSVLTATEFVNKLDDAIQIYIDGFKDKGISLMGQLGAGIRSGRIFGVVPAIKNIFSNSHKNGILDIIDTNKTAIKDSGISLIGEFNSGIAEEGAISFDVIQAVIDGCVNIFYHEDNKLAYMNAGKNVVDGFAKGITDNIPTVEAAIQAMTDATKGTTTSELDEHSPSKVFEKLGIYTVQGFAEGLEVSRKMVEDSISEVFGERLTTIAESMVERFGASSEEVATKIRDVFAKLYQESDAYKSSMERIKDYQKQIADIEANGTSDGSDAAERIKQLNESIRNEEEQMLRDFQSTFNDFYDTIKESVKSYLDIFNLEITSTINLFEQLDQAADDGISSALNILDVEGEVADKTDEINTKADILNSSIEKVSESTKKLNEHADILSANIEKNAEEANDFAKAMDILSVNLNDTIDTFAAYTKEDRIGTTTVLNRMWSQVDGVTRWMDKLDELAATGISDAMLTKLREMGTSGENYVDAFLRMTAEEIEEANAALEEQTRVSTQLYLDEMVKQLSDTKTWASNLKRLMKRGLDEGLLQELTELGPSGAEKVAAFVQMTDEEFKKLNDIYAESIEATESVTKKIGKITKKFAKEEEKAIAEAEKESMLDAMEETVRTTTNWRKNLAKLAKRGLHEGLLAELADMGPSGADKVKQFVDLTEEQFARLNDIYDRSITATEKANKAIAKYGSESIKTGEEKSVGQQLIDAMNKDIDDIDQWSKNLKKLAKRGIDQGLLKELADLGPSGADKVKQFVDMTSEELSKVNDAYARAFTISDRAQRRITEVTKQYATQMAEEQAEAEREAQKKAMIKAMSEQIDSVRTWASNLKKLSKRGINDGLLKALTELGPSGAEKVQLFVDLTDKEFRKLNKLYKESQEAAEETSKKVAKLTKPYDEKQAKKALLSGMRSQLDAVKEYNSDLKKLRKKGLSDGLLQEVEALGIEGADKVKIFLSMSANEITKANRAYKEKIELSNQALLKSMKDRLNTVKTWATDITKLQERGVNTDLLKQMLQKGPESLDYVQALLSLSNKDLKKFNKLYEQVGQVSEEVTQSVIGDFVLTGEQAAQGFGDGLWESQFAVNEAAATVGAGSLQAIQEGWGGSGGGGSYSSYYEAGSSAGQGFVTGLESWSNYAQQTAAETGHRVSESYIGSVSNPYDLMDNPGMNLDFNPVITPVVDMSNVEYWTNWAREQIDSITGNLGIDIGPISSQANELSSRLFGSQTAATDANNYSGSVNYTFNQNNYSPRALSRLDIYRNTQNQFAAFERSWR